MNQEEQKYALKVKRVVFWYNLVPNLFWSVINLVPVSFFCYRFLSLSLLFIFLGTSFITVFLPNTVFNWFQLGSTTTVYHKIGIRFINKFTQNGQLINKVIRRKFPPYRVVRARKKSVQTLLRQTYVFEKFHFIFFVFFNLVMAYALVKSFWAWAAVILINNILYNVYPGFLQQYIRLKLTPAVSRNKQP